jgi:predicted Zn-dependent protease
LARQSIAAAPPPAAQARSTEEDTAMLASVAGRLAAAAEPVCAAYLNRACGFVVRFDPSNNTARATAHGRDQVTVTAGMVRLVETEDELAAVVGHEFGHHLAGHLGRQRVRNTVAGTAASTLLGAVVPFGGLAAAALGQGAAQLGAGAARLAYSKAEEREADYLGAYLVARAGYDLDRAGNLWARLSRPDAARAGSGVSSLLATHPAEAERLAAWRRAAEEIRASHDLLPRRRAGP